MHWTGDGPADAVEVCEQSCSFRALGAGKLAGALANPGWHRERISSFVFVELKTLVSQQSGCLHLLLVGWLSVAEFVVIFGFQHDRLVVVSGSASSPISLPPLLGLCAPLQRPL